MGLVAYYQWEINAHACEDFVLQEEHAKEKVYEEQIIKQTTTVSSYSHKLASYHLRIQETVAAQVKLQAHIVQLAGQCKEMSATVSSLDKVRDAIQVLGVCPGLGPLEFHIPRWTGVWEQLDADSVALHDMDVDLMANNLCKTSAPPQPADSPTTVTYRAAEVSEIMLRALEDLPLDNSAPAPLLGTCPNCEGEIDQPDGIQHKDGHARICWDPAAKLNMESKRGDCSSGMKSILCVEEFTYYGSAGVPSPDAPNMPAGLTVPSNCRLFHDGCNTCEIDSAGSIVGCTKNTCISADLAMPECRLYYPR